MPGKRDEKTGKYGPREEAKEEAPATQDSGGHQEDTSPEPVAIRSPLKPGTFEAVWDVVSKIGNPIMLNEEVAHTIYDVLQSSKSKVCVEIGTHMGRSGSLIALCVKEWDGKLTTYDAYDGRRLSPGERNVYFGTSSGDEVAEIAQANFRGAGVVGVVTSVKEASPGAAGNHLDDSIDFLFMDADHTRVLEQLVAWVPKVAEGGTIIVDNADDPGVRMKIGRSGLEGKVVGTVYVATL